MTNSLAILGVLTAGIGGFILVASWDSRAVSRRRYGAAINILVYILIAAGIGLFAVGVFQ